MSTILCGVDDAAPARCAARVAVALARAAGARLILVHVTGVTPAAASVAAAGVSKAPRCVLETLARGDEVHDHATRWLSGFAGQVGAADAEPLVAPFGDPARRLSELAEQREADLLVVGCRGRSVIRDAILGSVSARLAADAPAPVLIVPPSVDETLAAASWCGRRIVCGYDGSESAWRGAVFAAGLAARVGAALHILHVLDGASELPIFDAVLEDELRSASAAASPSGGSTIAIAREHRRGDAADQLERVAAAATAPAIVLGTRGRVPWRSALVGSVSRRVLDLARRPIVLVPPAATLDAA